MANATCGCTASTACPSHGYTPAPRPAEAALRKLLADVQEGRDWWMTHVGERGQKPWAAMLSTGEQDYLERLAREGLGEP